MRRVLLLALLVVLAGCLSPFGTDETATPTPDGEERPDPETDRIGWEDGYWYDDPVNVDASDGLNASEREQVVARAMARVERIRQLEFERSVNVSVISQDNYSANDGSTGETLRAFDNAKFEALFLIGNEDDAISEQGNTRNLSVAGFYSPVRENIVLISDAASPDFDGERTLAHELVHALQDQHFNLSSERPRTRDAFAGRNGLIEGDARYVEQAYLEKCGSEWRCLPREESSDGGDGGTAETSLHLGVYVLDFFPYSDGVGLVSHLKQSGGWTAVNDAFADPPSSAASVVSPEKYGSFEPRAVQLRDRTRNGWERVRPSDRPDYGVLGQSALGAMFAYTLYDDYNTDSVVPARTFLNVDDGGEINRTDPFNYDLAATDGWTGDRLHAYQKDGEVAYVWRLTWENDAEAEEFADGYRDVLSHWGGRQKSVGVWTVTERSPFTGAVDIAVEGDTVTITGAPAREDLADVRRGSG